MPTTAFGGDANYPISVPSPPPATGTAGMLLDDSYIFAMKPNPKSQKAFCKHLHRQCQRQHQGERAEAAGLQPNSAHMTWWKEHEFVRSVKRNNRKIARPCSWAAHAKSIATPHMEWNETSFIEKQPAPPTVITVQASIMHWAHKSFGKKWQNDCPAPTEIGLQAYTDTYAQTCTSGLEILSMLRPVPSLISGTHNPWNPWDYGRACGHHGCPVAGHKIQ